ncbi:hypothetical protein, partial [Burkholderia sp. MSMB2157WGS]|uniref:hypothetical protein n=1 Tax=Burkholderia sp. MSMB2157WGS TaxID=1637928 RepID=UPI001C54DBEB
MLLKSVVATPVHTKLNRSRRNEVVKKVVDEFQKTVNNLASLLLKTQRCRETSGSLAECSLK